jgi:hypothetical protein
MRWPVTSAFKPAASSRARTGAWPGVERTSWVIALSGSSFGPDKDRHARRDMQYWKNRKVTNLSSWRGPSRGMSTSARINLGVVWRVSGHRGVRITNIDHAYSFVQMTVSSALRPMRHAMTTAPATPLELHQSPDTNSGESLGSGLAHAA